MSLWTPGGEHDVPDDRPGGGAGPDQLAQVRAQLQSVPASTVVANHVMGLYELAAIHLSNQPPNLGEGRVAIDAMAGVVEALEGRLGENEPVLRDALAQLRLAFVQLQEAVGDGDDSVDSPDDDSADS